MRQDSKILISSPREKLPKQGHSKAGHTSETNNKNVNTSDKIQVLHGNRMEREVRKKNECVKVVAQVSFITTVVYLTNRFHFCFL